MEDSSPGPAPAPRGGALSLVLRFAATNGWLLVINLSTGVLTARLLGEQGRGEYAAVMLWPMLFSFLSVMGLSNAVMFNIKNHPEKASQYLSSGTLLGVIYGLIGGAIGICIIPLFMTSYTPKIVLTAQLLMLTVPIGVFMTVLMSGLLAQDHFKLMNRLRYMPQMLSLVLFVVLALLKKLTPISAVLATTIPQVVMFPIIMKEFISSFKLDLTDFSENCRRLRRDGYLYALVDISSQISAQFDSVFVLKASSSAQNGVYSLGTSTARFVGMLQDAISLILLPKATGRSDEIIVEIAARTVRVLFIVLLGMVTAFWIVIPFLIEFVYGGFEGAVPVARILAVATMFNGLFQVLGQGMMALKKPQVFAFCQLGGTLVCLPIIFFAVRTNGLVGAATAFALAGLVRIVLLMFSFPVVLKQPMPRLILGREDIQWVRSMLVKS